ALLCIDEAHATGVFGAGGRGAAEAYDVDAEVDVVVGTLSKALGGIGGFIAARRELIDWIINTGGPFIYTTSLPPAACAAAVAALDVVESDEGLERRTRVLEHAAWLHDELAQRGFELCGSTSQIIPVMVGEAEAAVRFSEALQRAGFLIPCIRPPTVPRGTARLRISITAEHTREDLERLVSQLERCRST